MEQRAEGRTTVSSAQSVKKALDKSEHILNMLLVQHKDICGIIRHTKFWETKQKYIYLTAVVKLWHIYTKKCQVIIGKNKTDILHMQK